VHALRHCGEDAGHREQAAERRDQERLLPRLDEGGRS
jgi:hypothetical protein